MQKIISILAGLLLSIGLNINVMAQQTSVILDAERANIKVKNENILQQQLEKIRLEYNRFYHTQIKTTDELNNEIINQVKNYYSNLRQCVPGTNIYLRRFDVLIYNPVVVQTKSIIKGKDSKGQCLVETSTVPEAEKSILWKCAFQSKDLALYTDTQATSDAITTPEDKEKSITSKIFINSCSAGGDYPKNESVSADITPKAFPSDLIYKNKPIDPFCILNGALAPYPTPLNTCGDSSPVHYLDYREEGNPALIKAGYIGYVSKSKVPDNEIAFYGYYKLIGKAAGYYVIYGLKNDYEKNNLSNIYLVKRLSKDSISVIYIPGGDNCNKGINPDIEINDNRITYTKNLTPWNFFEILHRFSFIGQKNFPGNNPHYCEAIEKYEVDVTAFNQSGETFPVNYIKSLYIDLGVKNSSPFVNQLNQVMKENYQCFENIVNDYIKNGKRIISIEQLKDLVNTFEKNCQIKHL